MNERSATAKRNPLGVTVLAFALLAVAASVGAQEERLLPIIPGAAGFGMETPAGSGRHLDEPKTRVIRVTNLNTEGPGSLRTALEAEGPRVVVFEVSGNIDFTPLGDLSISNPYITIAGQTAPSPGITLKGCEVRLGTHDALMQHIRIRTGDLRDPRRPKVDPKSGWSQWSERDCMKVAGERIVIDHCSFSWATDENVQTRARKITFRQNLFGECLNTAKVAKPPVVVPGLKIKPVAEVRDWVLANAGARPADRDPVDKRVIKQVRARTGNILKSQDDVGGWPKLAENRRELTIPENPSGDDDGDGYTNLEEWLHGFAAKVEGR